jgi:hypothetical protein
LLGRARREAHRLVVTQVAMMTLVEEGAGRHSHRVLSLIRAVSTSEIPASASVMC